jgi:hypothetical protein
VLERTRTRPRLLRSLDGRCGDGRGDRDGPLLVPHLRADHRQPLADGREFQREALLIAEAILSVHVIRVRQTTPGDIRTPTHPLDYIGV